MIPEVLGLLYFSICGKIVGSGEQEPGGGRERPLNEVGVGQRAKVRLDDDVEVLSDDIHQPVAGMHDEVYFWMLGQEVVDNAVHGKLHGRHVSGASYAAARLAQPMPEDVFCRFRLPQHRDSALIEVLARIRHPELARSPVE